MPAMDDDVSTDHGLLPGLVICFRLKVRTPLRSSISIYTTFPKNCCAVAFKASSSSWE